MIFFSYEIEMVETMNLKDKFDIDDAKDDAKEREQRILNGKNFGMTLCRHRSLDPGSEILIFSHVIIKFLTFPTKFQNLFISACV